MTPRARAKVGEGSVYWSKSKNCWRIRLSITDSDSNRRQPSVGEYATRDEAITAHKAMRSAPVSDWTTMTWSDWLEVDIPRFIAKLRRSGQDSYADIIDTYFRLHLNHRLGRLGRMSETTPQQLDQVWDDLIAKPKSSSTVLKMKSAVSSSFIRAQAEGLNARNPVRLSSVPGLKRAKAPDVRPVELDEPLNLDEYVALRDRMIRLIEGGRASDALAIHWALPTIVLGETGARRGEVLGLQALDLRPGDLLRIERQVKIKRPTDDAPRQGTPRVLVLGPPKTDASYRTIEMSDLLRDLLLDHIRKIGASGRDQMFTNPETGGLLHPDSFTSFVQRQAKLIGVTRKVGPHTLRHTHITLLLADNQPDTFVSQRAGHDNSAYTRRQYVKFISRLDGTGKAWDRITAADRRENH